MPKFVNRNAHPVRVRTDRGLRRVRSGEVVNADGELADALKDTNGIDSASPEDEQKWEGRNQALSTDKTPGMETLEQVVASINTIQRVTVVDPLQVVVGDDEAPHGPPSGTITTKTAVREAGDLLDQIAFGEPGYQQAERADAAREPKEERATEIQRAEVQTPPGPEPTGESAIPSDAPSTEGDGSDQDDDDGEDKDKPRATPRGRKAG